MRGSTFKRCPCKPEDRVKGKNGKWLACKKHHGTWSYRLDVGDDPETGQRRRTSKGGFRTEEEADGALKAEMERVTAGTWTDDQKLTVGKFLDRWLERRAGALKASTLASYTSHIEQFIRPELGRLPLRELRTQHVYNMLAKVAEGRSPSTVQRVRATLRAALSSAERDRLLSWNPAKNLELASAEAPRVEPWEARETGAFLDHVFGAGDRLASVFHLGAYLGLRRGEILGLRWEDVDLVKRVIRVRQAVVSATKQIGPCALCGGIHREIRIETPKTRDSAATVALDAQTIGVLLQQQLAQGDERTEWGEAYLDHGLVFAREDGTPYAPNWVTKRFGDLRAGVTVPIDPENPSLGDRPLRKIRLHDLRHGAASLMIAAGVDMAIISKVLRHSTIRLTVDTYGHLLPGVEESTAEVRAAMIPRAGSKTVGHSSATN